MGATEELRDIEEIKKLKARYCYLVDECRFDELAELWTEDAVGDYGPWGIYRGRQEIMQKLFRETFNIVPGFVAHMIHNPIVEVRGDSASGQWYLTAQGTAAGTNQASWVMGRYQDEFQRVGNEWKIRSLKFELYSNLSMLLPFQPLAP